MSQRNLYLHTVTPEEALSGYLGRFSAKIRKKREIIPVRRSLGRITFEAVYAKRSSPLFNAAAMDGIAVISSHTRGASETSPLTLKEGRDCMPVDTGDPVNPPFDAVIMAEDLLETEQENEVRILSSVPAWQYIRPVGEDIVEGEMILPGLHKIRPIDIGVLLSGGILEIPAVQRPTVGIIPTGTEIIEPEDTPHEGSIIESNSALFAAMTEEAGGIPKRYPIVKDDFQEIKTAVQKALEENDLVLLNAGSSAGREDFAEPVLKELGEVFVHGVSMKPGKPVILAEADGRPVIGLPGYPVSAYLDFVTFVTPVLNLFSGENVRKTGSVRARLSRQLYSSLKNEEYVRVKVGRVGENYIASPLPRGASAAMSLVRADGFCMIPRSSEGFGAGEEVTVELYRTLDEIGNTLVSIGSHDPIMDVIADRMPTESPGTYLSSTHVGSMGGLLALKRGEAHLAPTHLLDEETGVYNVAAIRKLFPDGEMVLVRGVMRVQGILVQKGNPLGIRGIADLTKCRYINRQRGAGTRVLLDYELKKAGIRPEEIEGYETEAATHMAVAALIKNGSADAGMGIYSAAHAMNLDFIPVGNEEYQFALEKKTLELPMMQTFLKILKSGAFRKKLDEMGGYDAKDAGEIAWES